jgi:hypothetical protein
VGGVSQDWERSIRIEAIVSRNLIFKSGRASVFESNGILHSAGSLIQLIYAHAPILLHLHHSPPYVHGVAC